jgi:hypothetical protein
VQPAKEKADAKDVFEKVKEWRAAAAEHDVGKPDAAAKLIGRWPIKDLELVIEFMAKLSAQPQSAIKRALSKARYRRALNTTDQEAKSGDLNRLLKQGALLHTDIELLALQTWAYQDISEATGAFVDGRIMIQPRRFHWEFARRLIDSVGPVAANDPMVRQWYVATTAHMQDHRLLGYADKTSNAPWCSSHQTSGFYSMPECCMSYGHLRSIKTCCFPRKRKSPTVQENLNSSWPRNFCRRLSQ